MKSAILTHLLPRLESILFLSVFMGVALLGPRLLNQDGDIGRHITIGEYILNNRTIPLRDAFSHTMAGEVITPHEWMAQALFALAHRVLGLSGVVLLSSLVIALSWLLLYEWIATQNGLPIASLIIVLISLAAASLHFLARPHIFTFLFFALWLVALEKVRLDQRIPLWTFPIIMLFWANTHGAFIAGFVCWAAYILDGFFSIRNKEANKGRLRKFLTLGVLSFLATFINPVGWRLWQTSVGYIGNRYLVGHTQEYLPPDFHHPSTWPFLLLIAMSLFLLTSLRRPLPLTHRLLLSGWTLMALYSARNIPLYSLTASFILGEAMTNAPQDERWKRLEDEMLNLRQTLQEKVWIPLGVLVLSLLLLRSPAYLEHNRFDPSVFPVDATNWLLNHPQQGNMFNEFTWGGYLLYRLWPNYQVFIDGQTDFYGEHLTRDYETVITLGPGWQSRLEAYQVTWILYPTDSPLVRSISSLEDWVCLYRDRVATICHKRLPNPPSPEETENGPNHP